MQNLLTNLCLISASVLLFTQCKQETNNATAEKADTIPAANFNGYASLEQWGEHLVTVSGCNDCHTPKKFENGMMMLDSSRLLSGHPSELPPPDVNRSEMEKKGNIVTQTLTAWTGPWGTSFTANLTPDPTGLGNWEESNFFTAIRHGKFKGIESGRSLLPPMPWEMYRNMTDRELKAVFAFLKSIKPVKNVVPSTIPPMSAGK